jgi:hypothetical protein
MWRANIVNGVRQQQHELVVCSSEIRCIVLDNKALYTVQHQGMHMRKHGPMGVLGYVIGIRGARVSVHERSVERFGIHEPALYIDSPSVNSRSCENLAEKENQSIENYVQKGVSRVPIRYQDV